MPPIRRLELDLRDLSDEGLEQLDIAEAVRGKESLRNVHALHLLLSKRHVEEAPRQAIIEWIESTSSLTSLILHLVGPPHTNDLSFVVNLGAHSRSHGLHFTVDFTLDAQADALAALDGRDTSLSPILNVSRALQDRHINVRWSIPIIQPLIFRLEALVSLARDEQVDPVLAPAWMNRDRQYQSTEALQPDEVLFVWDFITYRLLDEERHLLTSEGLSFYEELRASLVDEELTMHDFSQPTAVLRPSARENASSWEWSTEHRPTVSPTTASQTPSASTPAKVFNQAAELLGVLLEGLLAFVEWTITQITCPARSSETPAVLPKVLIIGAYGGEHIGDTAILGGVLLRIHRQYGTTSAILMSQRAYHTRHLVPMLETPVEVEVEAYRQRTVRELLPDVDAVIFAGGPLMDIPKQLVKHLYTVSLAYRNNKPFIAEGIGAGPFIRTPSAWVGRRLVAMAERITVRTSTDAEQPLVQGLHPDVGRDPAFDYLETRPERLTRIPPADERWLQRLLDDTEGRAIIGINLRPISPLYTVGVPTNDRVEYTRSVEAQFEEHLAKGLVQYHKSAASKPCFIFYPMNAIQFGMSDLRSAYRVKRLVGAEIDVRVWEGDASIDGVVALLRRVDIAITMRFHATIYALSQNRPVIGIDYRIGKRDKVAALLADRDQEDRCQRIDQMTSEWLHQKLCELTDLPRCNVT